MPQPTTFNRRFTGKVAIVTGAGCRGKGWGTGNATAFRLAAEGASVCLLDIEVERAEETRAQIAAQGGVSIALRVDVSDPDQCAAAVEEAVQQFGRLDILVNNVGVYEGDSRSMGDFDHRRWARIVDVNFKGTVLMCKYAVPKMAAGGGGAIVNTSSIAGIRAHGSTAYGPSKAAVIAFSRELAVMHGRDKVRVNVVSPGHVYSPHVQGFIDGHKREVRRLIAPLGIEGDAWDVAAATLFLASDEARFITGVCVPVDGGLSELGPLAAFQFASQAQGNDQ